MKKLTHLFIALNDCGLAPESYLIQKLARQYVERASVEGLSSKFYGAVRFIESDISSWKTNTKISLINYFLKKHPKIDPGDLSGAIDSCLNDWARTYSGSINSSDTSIPPWLFNFLEAKVFPLIKSSLSESIESLPADSETKLGLQNWLSVTTLEQLGAPNVAELLDGGAKLWRTSIHNLVHEIHHNILNHSIWKRFSRLGNRSDEFNLLDAMEEGFATTLQKAYQYDNINDAYEKFAEDMADFITPILKKIIPHNRGTKFGISLSQHWDVVHTHLAEIVAEEMGVKDSEKKIIFLRKVFETLKNNNDLTTFSGDFDLSSALASAILQVWSERDSGGEAYSWDFLTGDDEILSINLMKNLDEKFEELLKLWDTSKEEHFIEALSAVESCVEKTFSGT